MPWTSRDSAGRGAGGFAGNRNDIPRVTSVAVVVSLRTQSRLISCVKTSFNEQCNTVYTIQRTLYSVHYTAYDVQYTAYIVIFIVYCTQFDIKAQCILYIVYLRKIILIRMDNFVHYSVHYIRFI